MALQLGGFMKHSLIIVLLLVIPAIATLDVSAQEVPGTAEKLETLKLQLIDVQAKVEALSNRLEQLEYDLKPENIERSLAGIGSTKPEDLREERRRQLTLQRDNAKTQLQTLELQQERLETAIADLERRAYQESAQPPQSSSLMLKPSFFNVSSVKFWTAVSMLVLVAGALFFFFRRSMQSS
jgi:hypothetical protein